MKCPECGGDMEKGRISAWAWPYLVRVYWKGIVEISKTTEELYERLLDVYKWRHVLEDRIVSVMKEGLSREEAIRKIAEIENTTLGEKSGRKAFGR